MDCSVFESLNFVHFLKKTSKDDHFGSIISLLTIDAFPAYWSPKSSQLFWYLKGKVSSGIEGALASKLNHDFNWKQLCRNDSLYFSLDVFKVYLSNIDSETGEI